VVRAPWSAAVALLLVLPVSGCLGSGTGKAFDSVAVPVWSAGHSWTYQVGQSSSEPGDGGSGAQTESHETRVTQTVFNTTEPLEGSPVYYVRTSTDDGKFVDDPFLAGGIIAYEQSDLRVVGHGWDDGTSAPHAVPVSHGSGDLPPPPADPCEGRGHIEPTSDDVSFPGPAFPLRAGSTDRGTWGEGGDEGPRFDYVLRVEGVETIEVPAGTFDAIHVSVDMSPALGDGTQEFLSFHVRGDSWYAPAVENYVRTEFVASATSGFTGRMESYSFESHTALASYVLGEVPESPAPAAYGAYPAMMPSYEIVSDIRLPQNVADGPVTARFALAKSEGQPGVGVRSVEAFPPPLPFDGDKYTVYWRVTPGDFVQMSAGTGLVYERVFDRAGTFAVFADVRPLDCGLPAAGTAVTRGSNYWERSWSVAVDAGLPRQITIDTFPVESMATTATLAWSTKGTGLDEGYATLTDPQGHAHKGSQGTSNPVWYGPGTWRIEWQAQGKELAYGTATPVVGDDVTLRLRIDYEDAPFHFVKNV
jgi:hypothetical protein